MKMLEEVLIKAGLFNKGDFKGCVENLSNKQVKGYKCYMFLDTYKRKKREEDEKKYNWNKISSGYANGLIIFQADFSLMEMDFLAKTINVHGSVTICKKVDNWIILGFDTMHYGDDLVNWSKQNCNKELLKMFKQIELHLLNRKLQIIEFIYKGAKMTIELPISLELDPEILLNALTNEYYLEEIEIVSKRIL